MLHVGFDCIAECIFCTLHEVAASTTVAMNFNTSGHYIHPFGIEQFGSYHCKVAVCYFKNLVIAHQHRAVLEPSGRSENLGVYNLSKHRCD